MVERYITEGDVKIGTYNALVRALDLRGSDLDPYGVRLKGLNKEFLLRQGDNLTSLRGIGVTRQAEIKAACEKE